MTTTVKNSPGTLISVSVGDADPGSKISLYQVDDYGNHVVVDEVVVGSDRRATIKAPGTPRVIAVLEPAEGKNDLPSIEFK